MNVKKNSLLWKISPPKANFISYLYGTMHVKDERAFAYFEQCQEYILQCSSYAAEMNLKEAQDLGSPSDYQLPNQSDFLDYLSEKKLAKIRIQLIKSFGIDILPMRRMYPLFVTNLIAESLLGSFHEKALDQAMWDFAEENRLEMTGVESYRDQMNTLYSLNIKTQFKQLQGLAKNPIKIRQQTSKMSNLYMDMNIRKLYLFAQKGLGKLRYPLIHFRNERMADTISSIVNQQPTFVAIGAGHLGGQFGVLSRLKKFGYIIKPVKLIR